MSGEISPERVKPLTCKDIEVITGVAEYTCGAPFVNAGMEVFRDYDDYHRDHRNMLMILYDIKVCSNDHDTFICNKCGFDTIFVEDIWCHLFGCYYTKIKGLCGDPYIWIMPGLMNRKNKKFKFVVHYPTLAACYKNIILLDIKYDSIKLENILFSPVSLEICLKKKSMAVTDKAGMLDCLIQEILSMTPACVLCGLYYDSAPTIDVMKAHIALCVLHNCKTNAQYANSIK